jgi:hypothetical protein
VQNAEAGHGQPAAGPFRGRGLPRAGPARHAGGRYGLEPTGRPQTEADRLLLTRYAPPGVLVNEQLDILQFRGHTGPYLEAPPGESTMNLLKRPAQGLFVELRTALTEAIAGLPRRQGSCTVGYVCILAQDPLREGSCRCARGF